MSINKNIPVTNREKYLAKIAGEEVSASNPINREDYFLNEIAEKDDSGSGGGSGGSEPLVVHLVVTQEESYTYVTFDKNWTTVKNAFPNVCIEVVTEDDELSGLSYDSILTVGSVEELEQYFILVSAESTVNDIYEKKVFSCVSPDGMPFFRYSIVV